MEEVIQKLSKGKTISLQLNEAFIIAGTGGEDDFSVIEYTELQILSKEYNNQIKYETSTVDSCGELNNAYKSLFHISERLRSLAKRIIEANTKKDD